LPEAWGWLYELYAYLCFAALRIPYVHGAAVQTVARQFVGQSKRLAGAQRGIQGQQGAVRVYNQSTRFFLEGLAVRQGALHDYGHAQQYAGAPPLFLLGYEAACVCVLRHCPMIEGIE